MAKEVLKNAYVSINSVVLSDHVRSLTLPLSAAEIDKTCMGDDSVARITGLKDARISVTFAQDFDASEVDVTLWGVYNTGTAVAIIVRPSAGDIGIANPSYTFNAILTEYPPIDGAVGDLHEITAEFMADGDVTRATS